MKTSQLLGVVVVVVTTRILAQPLEQVAGIMCRPESSGCRPRQFPCHNNSSSTACLSRAAVCDGRSDSPDNSDEGEELSSDVGMTRVVESNVPTNNIPGAALGLVYVKHQGEWGTVCDDTILHQDAKVICRSLGYSCGWCVPFTRSYLGKGEGRIWVTKPGCTGEEAWLGQCPNVTFNDTHCRHKEDTSIFCYDGGMEVRVVGDKSQGSGQVEVKLGGQWGRLGGTGFDDLDARVVCKMLGYHGDARAGSARESVSGPISGLVSESDSGSELRTGSTPDPVSGPGAGSNSGPVWQVVLDCVGEENHLDQCRIRFRNTTCLTTNTAAVTCSHTVGAVDDALRSLLGGEACGVVEDASQYFLTRLARVRGGVAPNLFGAPWLVSIRTANTRTMGGRLVCGGTIISEYYVVTAAHCLRTLGTLHLLVVRVGDYNTNYIEVSEEEYLIDKAWQHEDFEDLHFLDNDIALLKVESKNGRGIRFGPQVKPLCLPRTGVSYQDLEDCTIVGWGIHDNDGNNSDVPIEGQVSILEDHLCEQRYSGGARNYTSSFLCAGSLTRAVNSCQGDSGGPLTCQVKGGPRSLYGIVSNGIQCRPGRASDKLTRVTKYLNWLHDKIFGGHV